MLLEEGIERIVTKNSGGSATESKLLAAKELGLPVSWSPAHLGRM